MAKRYRSCPNPECRSSDTQIGWVLTNSDDDAKFVFCAACHLKGPRAKARSDAERLWNLIPREIAAQEPVSGEGLR